MFLQGTTEDRYLDLFWPMSCFFGVYNIFDGIEIKKVKQGDMCTWEKANTQLYIPGTSWGRESAARLKTEFKQNKTWENRENSRQKYTLELSHCTDKS